MFSIYTSRNAYNKVDDAFKVEPKFTMLLWKGDYDVEPSVPESFNVIVREMQSLCLDIIKLAKVETAIDIEEKKERGDFILLAKYVPTTSDKFDALQIHIASPDEILKWSKGEVKETRNLKLPHF
jgi:hypothetical protein